VQEKGVMVSKHENKPRNRQSAAGEKDAEGKGAPEVRTRRKREEERQRDDSEIGKCSLVRKG